MEAQRQTSKVPESVDSGKHIHESYPVDTTYNMMEDTKQDDRGLAMSVCHARSAC